MTSKKKETIVLHFMLGAFFLIKAHQAPISPRFPQTCPNFI